MTARFRDRTFPRQQGTCTILSGSGAGTVYQDGQPHNGYERVNDHIDVLGDCHPFDLMKYTHTGGIISTQMPADRQFSGYKIAGFSAFTEISTFPGQKPYGTYATELRARTSPSRPYVDVPVTVLELGDAAQLIKKSGDDFIKRWYGSKYIEKKFFWDPLLGDMWKMTEFHDQVARRVAELKRLQSPKGYRRTVELDSLSSSKTASFKANSSLVSYPTKSIEVRGKRLIKGHVRWLPVGDFHGLPESTQVRLLRRAMLGLTVDISTLWELMPWSWLIDWGWNIGAFLRSQRNQIPAQLDKCVITQHTYCEATFPPNTSGQHTHSAGKWEYNEKLRFQQSAIPVAHFPFLTQEQMGIVAALAITRM